MIEFLQTAVSVLASVVAVAGFCLRPINRLEERLKRLEEERLGKIEEDVEKLDEKIDQVREESNPALIAERLDSLKKSVDYNSQLQRHNELKLGAIEKSVAELSRDVKGLDKWQNNLNTDFQDHVKDKVAHYGKQ